MSIHIGKSIEELSRRRGISTKELAERIGKTEQHMYRIYKQEHINTELLQTISSELKVPLTYFFKGEPEAANHQVGFANQTGSGNSQKIMEPAAEYTRKGKYNIEKLESSLQTCQSEKNYLERQISTLEQLVQTQGMLVNTQSILIDKLTVK